MGLKISMQKGCQAHRKYHNARVSGIKAAQYVLHDRSPRGFMTSLKGGYSGWRRLYGRVKPSAFKQRFLNHGMEPIFVVSMRLIPLGA